MNELLVYVVKVGIGLALGIAICILIDYFWRRG